MRPRDLVRRRLLVAGVLAMTATAVPTQAWVRPARGDDAPSDAVALARRAARQFLGRYVDESGRVVRHDQGADTVGEGQSYALVLALVAGDEQTFSRVWRWTDAHLRRPDGLLDHRAAPDGTIDDQSSATDADLVTAWALLRAGGAYTAEGAGLAAAILDHETLVLPDGRSLLTAGDWATGAPATLNPSYWAVPMVDGLAAMTGDPRWASVQASARLALGELTGKGTLLPPDWARVDGTTITATPSPGGDVPDVRYSLDAQRVIVWLAAGDSADRGLAAGWWPVLRDKKRAEAIALAPQGTVLDTGRHPLPLVATAAAAIAAGHDHIGARLLRRASALKRRNPTYYGSAWVALGRALLTTDLLDAGAP